MKQFGLGVLILLCGMGYWNFRVYQKTKFLTELSQPFLAACQGSTGCIVAPDGWKPERNGDYYREMMMYSTHDDEFIIDWHIATDVHLVATGGKKNKLSVKRVVN